jgi:hypothetical protein
MTDNDREFISGASKMIQHGVAETSEAGSSRALTAAIATILLDIAASLRKIQKDHSPEELAIREIKKLANS